jgi:hypothetical protein
VTLGRKSENQNTRFGTGCSPGTPLQTGWFQGPKRVFETLPTRVGWACVIVINTGGAFPTRFGGFRGLNRGRNRGRNDPRFTPSRPPPNPLPDPCPGGGLEGVWGVVGGWFGGWYPPTPPPLDLTPVRPSSRWVTRRGIPPDTPPDPLQTPPGGPSLLGPRIMPSQDPSRTGGSRGPGLVIPRHPAGPSPDPGPDPSQGRIRTPGLERVPSAEGPPGGNRRG